MDKKFAIFDMDGTLVDSMGLWKNLAGEYLLSKGITRIPQELFRRIGPMTMSESAALFQTEFGLSGDVEEEMNKMMAQHYRRDVPLFPGVEAYLRRLQAKGVRMCVASTTALPLMKSCLDRLGVLPCFEFLLSCESVGAGKQSPLIYLEAARRLGAQPGDIAVLEDAPYALQTAKQAGFYTVAVLCPNAPADEYMDNWEETV